MKNKLAFFICGFLFVSNTALASVNCESITENEVAKLFEDWNEALKSGDPTVVVNLYAENAVLLPTVSNKMRLTQKERLDYFTHFLEKKPMGKIDRQVIKIGCNKATNTGHYTFHFSDNTSLEARYSYTYVFKEGKWLISSHHSSLLPEK